jgi:uncharacterized protein HemY
MRRLIKEEDGAIDELVEDAATLEEQGARREAMQLLCQASERCDDPVVLTRLGSLAMDLELWDESETALQGATRLDSDFTPGYVYSSVVVNPRKPRSYIKKRWI